MKRWLISSSSVPTVAVLTVPLANSHLSYCAPFQLLFATNRPCSVCSVRGSAPSPGTIHDGSAHARNRERKC